MRVAVAVAALCLSAAGIAGSPGADAAIRRLVDIPAQPLGAALEVFEKQRELRVVFMSEDVRNVTTQGVSGELTVEEALHGILNGTGLTFRFMDSNTVSIVPVDQGSPQADRGGSVPADSPELEEVVVTGSRVDRAGFDAPTPTTVIGDAELRFGARPNIAAVLNDIPQFRATTTGFNTGGNTATGIVTADLRGLGAERTLTLLNNRRFSGSADLNSVPKALVRRVEVVTGGASAAWGSGAVAGVVNILLDDEFEGVRLGASKGVSSRSDGSRYGLEAAFGTKFAEGRGSYMIGAEYMDDSGAARGKSRPWLGAGLYTNPAYTPTNGEHQYLRVPDVNYSNAALGGLITSGYYAGQTFNPDGTLRPFNFGNPRNSSTMVGGEGLSLYDETPAAVPYERINVYNRVAYDLGGATLWADVNFGQITADYDAFSETSRGNITVSRDNPFLSQTIRDQLTAVGESTFTFGRYLRDIGLLRLESDRRNLEGAIGVDGTFADGAWRYSAYYGHGELRNAAAFDNLRITSNFANAIDVVVGPDGAPVCRVALTDPDTACRPLNLFGYGNASAEAAAYAFGRGSTVRRTELDTIGVSLRGEPLSLWAGPVSIAVGAEARREALDVTVDPLSAAGRFSLLNFATLSGSLEVREGFGEVVLPLLDVADVNRLELNGAVRYSDYSTSGGISSWKIGLTDRLFDNLLLRVVGSRDIRSANLGELYTTHTTQLTNIVDPTTSSTHAVTRYVGGNPALAPEVGHTFTAGASFSPASGFDVSVDYYDIRIDDVITTLSAQDIVSRCFAGNASLCNQIVRSDDGISAIYATYINLAEYRTRGVDFETSYVLPLASIFDGLSGSLRFRGLVTRALTLSTDDGITKIEVVGDVGDNVTFSTPKWKATGAVTYLNDDATIDLRVRYVGGGTYNHLLDIANNRVSSRVYLDLGGTLDIGAFQWFLIVNNLFDRDPPLTAGTGQALYDQMGRYFTGGVKLRF